MPVHTVVLTVGLKITDNEARSALEAIQVKMGLGEQVRALAREDRWELDVETETAAEAEAAVARLVQTTNVFANPNKHRYAFAPAGASHGADLAPDEVAVLVTDREGAQGESMVVALRRAGAASVVAVRRSARWRVRLATPPAPGQPGLLELVRRIGVAESRSEGLLANPHSQTVRAVFPWGEQKPLVD